MSGYFRFILLCFFLAPLSYSANSQTLIKGEVLDAASNDPLIGATIIVKGGTTGTTSDWDGSFEFSASDPFPIELEFSYIGYLSKTIFVESNKRISITLEEDAVVLEGVEITGSRISDKQKESPLTVEAMDLIAIKETPAADFYDGLGALKGVDLTAASLGFKVVNTRGFNSTSPVRSLQIIDGVDNQAPGLNFSLGNFLGTSELDVNKVELVVGASSAFYGPNAFNGVISMETKDPFFHEGLSVMAKAGERAMLKTAIRWADAVNNKKGFPFLAYKLNFEYLQANDWVADNYDPIDGSEVPADNPGRYDAVNIYGDEYDRSSDFSSFPLWQFPGLGNWHRTGYKEIDLVDYDTRNTKANVGLHFRTSPSKMEQSPELLIKTNFGSGTTVYQGENRFSLKNITFLQNHIEFKKRNKYFLRAYTTRTQAGDSYDPYFTALEMIERAKTNQVWSSNYVDYWLSTVNPQIEESDFPKLTVMFDPETGMIITDFDAEGARQWIIDNNDQLTQWHTESEAHANTKSDPFTTDFYEPGTARFDSLFNEITTTLRGQGGTKFFDNSALYHAHGEYIFTPTWMDRITVGANARLYSPDSKGTVFSDTADIKITNTEIGFYGGLQKSFWDHKMKATVALRADKNENYDLLFSPAGSLVYTPTQNNFLRVSFSSAIRNPTLADQYLYLDVGRAVLSGNLSGAKDLLTVESLVEYFKQPRPGILDSFDIDPVQPEEVKTFEVGYRTTLFDKLYVDAGYYYSIYDHFLGFNIGVEGEIDLSTGIPTRLQAFRYAANSKNQVTTQGFSIGLNYFLPKNLSLNGNYSYNNLLKTVEDDPIIPAFNTPKHKFNLGLSGRDMNLVFGGWKIKHFGFNINYKWIEGFLFEGSPQFTGFIPSYDLLDAQINFRFSKIDTTIKIGASNILNNLSFQTYGGPRIGRLAYITLTYEGKKR